MRTRIFALATITALPLAAAALGVAPASAATSACGHYPPGNAYGLYGSQSAPAGGQRSLNARVTYPGDRARPSRPTPGEAHCGNKRVAFYVAGPGSYKRTSTGRIDVASARFHLSGASTSNADGLASVTKPNATTTRQAYLWYATFTSDNHTGTAKSQTLQVGP